MKAEIAILLLYMTGSACFMAGSALALYLKVKGA